jgi:ribonucleoside-triphosphate reductase
MILKYVVTRDGSFAEFDPKRISASITKAVRTTGEFGTSEINYLAYGVIKKLNDGDVGASPNIEDIQDLIEEILIENGYVKTSKAYILYRNERGKLRKEKQVLVDVVSSVDEYIDQVDWRVNENANSGYTLGGLILNLSGKIVANYWLNRIYPPSIADLHKSGFIHIHDLDMLSGYCAGWSLRTLLQEGLNGVSGKVESAPPSHLSSALGQIVNFLGTLQNEWAGAQAFSSFDTYLAPFIRKDNLDYVDVYQCIQSFVYNMNIPSRWGTQTPFSNLTFDWVCPDDLENQRPIIAGTECDFLYGDLQKEMNMVNRAYIEVMTRGDSKGRVFTFPIPTYNITKDFDWYGENTNILFEMTAKYGLPYFQNFINSDLDPHMIRSMCCRLQLDLRELLKRGNSLFGSAEQTGSVGVVTINCARLGYLHKGNKLSLYDHLDELIERSKKSLEIKRKVITRFLNQGLYPFTQRYLGTFRNHFSTIGVNGVNEMIRNFTNDEYDITSEKGKSFAIELLDHLRKRLVEFQEETGHLYNLEATPAEGATYRFAKEDRKRYPDIIQAGTEDSPYYTNSSQIPVGYTDDMFERISDFDSCRNIVKKVLEKYRIPYITITPTFSICPKHGYIAGKHEYCPICDQELARLARKSSINHEDET